MTIDERAKRIAANLLASFDGDVFWEEAGDWNARNPDPNLVAGIGAAIREAVAEAHQTCARIAENAEKVGMGHAEVAATIRARATHPEPQPPANKVGK